MITVLVILKTESIWNLVFAIGIPFAILVLILRGWAAIGDRRDERQREKIVMQEKRINDHRSTVYDRYKQHSVSKKDFNSIKSHYTFPLEVAVIVKAINREIGVKKNEIEQYEAKSRSMFPEDVRQHISDDDLWHFKDEAKDQLKQLRDDRDSLNHMVKVFNEDKNKL